MSDREIAAELLVSERTAANHVQRLLSRLGLHSRAQVAAWSAERGLHEATGQRD